MLKWSTVVVVVAVVFSVACGRAETQVQATLEGVKATLEGVKAKSVSFQGEEGKRVASDFVATAVMGELLKRGAVASEDGLEISGRVEWVTSGSGYFGVKITATVFDPQGISFSVAVEDNLSSIGPHSYVNLARNVAVQFGRTLDEQVGSQRGRGRTKTVKPQEPPVPDPNKATSRVGLPDTSSLKAPVKQ